MSSGYAERGVVAMDRGIFKDPDFADEPLTEREAFMWLVSEAAWKPYTKRVGSHVVEVRRGQVVASVRFMAEAWKWSKSRVGRFLDRLKNRDTIGTDARDSITVITICNYDKFQIGKPEAGQQRDSNAGQQRDKLESSETEDLSISGARVLTLDHKAEFRTAFWPLYPHKVGKVRAEKAFLKARKSGAELQDILDGLRRYIGGKPDWCAWKDPATFLNGEHWNDEPAAENSRDRQPARDQQRKPAIHPGFAAVARELDREARRSELDQAQDFFGGSTFGEPEARDRGEGPGLRCIDGGRAVGSDAEGPWHPHGHVSRIVG